MTYDEIINSIRSCVNGNMIDNDEMVAILRKHCCYYLLSKLPSQKQALQMELMANRLVINRRYKACADIFKQLADIPYAVIKGAVLSKQIYGSTAYRFSGDIDLLVSPNNAEAVKMILTNNGFVQGRIVDNEIVPYTRRELIYQRTFSHQLAAFVKATGDSLCPFLNIDVNTDIMWGESEVKTDMETFLSNTVSYEIDGIKLKKLAPEEEFIALCLHHYKDMNSIYLLSQGSLKLSLFCDIYYYIKNISLNIPELLSKSGNYKVLEYLHYCIYYTYVIFGDDFLHGLADTFKSPDGEALIKRVGLAKDEYHTWDDMLTYYSFTDYITKLESILSSRDREKIELNRKMM